MQEGSHRRDGERIVIGRRVGLRPLSGLAVACLALGLGLRGPEWAGRGLANLGWVLTLRTWVTSQAFAGSAWQDHPGPSLLQWGSGRAGLGVAYGAVFAGQPPAALPCDALARRGAPGVPAWHLAQAGCALAAGRREEAAEAYYCALLGACDRLALSRFEHDLVRERHDLLSLALGRPTRESGSSPPPGEGMKLPTGSVSLPVGSGWAIAGLDYDSELLGLDPVVELSLVWRRLSPVAEPAPSWQRLEGDLWLERRAAWNLVCDPGFEWPATGCGGPGGYRGLPYAPYAGGVVQVVPAPAGGHGRALALWGGEGGSAGVRSLPFPVRGAATYLQAGRASGSGPGIRLGRQWSGALEGDAARHPYSFLAVQRGRPYQAEVVQAPAGATACEVWAINWQSSERALFDDLLFVELPPAGGS